MKWWDALIISLLFSIAFDARRLRFATREPDIYDILIRWADLALQAAFSVYAFRLWMKS